MLGADRREHSEEMLGFRNDYLLHLITTQVFDIDLRIPMLAILELVHAIKRTIDQGSGCPRSDPPKTQTHRRPSDLPPPKDHRGVDARPYQGFRGLDCFSGATRVDWLQCRHASLVISLSVVGILLAALFLPVWPKGILGFVEFSLALLAIVLW